MPNEESPIEPAADAGAPEHAATAERSAAMHKTAVQAPAPAYEPDEDGSWLDEPEELPRRPRRRLLAPVPIALLILLLTACGFIGGVLVEKGQGSSSSSSSGTGSAGLASRFAALRRGSSGAAGANGGASVGAAGGGGLFGSGSSASASGGVTTGQVAFVRGGTLYVTTTEGNTVKVTTSKASTVTKTVKAAVGSIHPGETVLVTGTPGTSGAISAESIRVGASGGGGLAGLFGRSSGGSSSGGSAAGRGGGGGGEPALFGKDG
jgi:hypothetical protein